eukprot:CAMPEP_0182909070 /NCGR_PEP_ID=MMETSP0034_2-20130328/35557_1 /TAXON_ID=156128 /ORGANISM="Nephroselmis pyriformis, Strain CCMP717" /LENGTH=85 /DNA_ID=CAMNT_0025045299 /DNA_START=43 /DNA_END=297 /DNA_ORIENTATION=-
MPPAHPADGGVDAYPQRLLDALPRALAAHGRHPGGTHQLRPQLPLVRDRVPQEHVVHIARPPAVHELHHPEVAPDAPRAVAAPLV